MPPCAHTECERFTGTMENRSTFAPISAILMTAASPASPPPMTMILGAAISLHRLSVRSGFWFRRVARVHDGSPCRRSILKPLAECVQAHQAHRAHEQKKSQAQPEKSLLRLVAGNNSPLGREQPDAIGEMPRGANQPDHVEGKQQRVMNLRRNLAERELRMIVQVNPGKAHRVGMPQDVKEGDAAGPALRRIQPVSSPGIFRNVALAAIPDVETVERMERDGQPDPEQFKEENQGKICQKADLARVGRRSADRGRVRNQSMFKEKRAHRNDAREGMQSAQNKGCTLAGAQGRDSMRYNCFDTGSIRTGC